MTELNGGIHSQLYKSNDGPSSSRIFRNGKQGALLLTFLSTVPAHFIAFSNFSGTILMQPVKYITV